MVVLQVVSMVVLQICYVVVLQVVSVFVLQICYVVLQAGYVVLQVG